MTINWEAQAPAVEQAMPDLEPEQVKRLAFSIAFYVEFYRDRFRPPNKNKMGPALRRVARDARKLAEALAVPVGKHPGAVGGHLSCPTQGHEDRAWLDVEALLTELGRLERRAEALADLCHYPKKRRPDAAKDEFVESIAAKYAEITGRKPGFSIDLSGEIGGPFARVLKIAADDAGLDDSLKALRERFARLKVAETLDS